MLNVQGQCKMNIFIRNYIFALNTTHFSKYINVNHNDYVFLQVTKIGKNACIRKDTVIGLKSTKS